MFELEFVRCEEVAAGEDVVGVELGLDGLHGREADVPNGRRHPLFAQLAHAVVVRNAAAASENFIAGRSLQQIKFI